MAKPKKWVIIIPLIAGIAGLVMLKQNQMPPIQEAKKEQAKLVRVIAAPQISIAPRAIGHGAVRPARTWEAVAQVKGQILEKHPRLQKGAILEQGTLLLGVHESIMGPFSKRFIKKEPFYR